MTAKQFFYTLQASLLVMMLLWACKSLFPMVELPQWMWPMLDNPPYISLAIILIVVCWLLMFVAFIFQLVKLNREHEHELSESDKKKVLTFAKITLGFLALYFLVKAYPLIKQLIL